MHRHPIISFLSGFIICGIFFGIIYSLVLLMTFNLAGGETLKQIETQRTEFLIFTIVLALFAGITAIQFLKSRKKFTAYGISALAVLTVLIVTVYHFYSLNIHERFDKTVWEQSKWKPFNMSATLVKEYKLIGLTRKQIKDLLGQPAEEYGDKNSDRGSILYLVKDDWTMSIYIQMDKVVD